ncbi:glutamate synthase-related protein [Streptomyces sp. Marseille-Q5077]|uniref:glutamate synthase-related protein n=1 Tax=Streptomyces sp. Marseille-Q5077 TaxID=3418995 RepID=UPI003D030FA0
MTLRAVGFPESEVRRRARRGADAAFPAGAEYGSTLLGADVAPGGGDDMDHMRLVPPVFTPHRWEKLLELGREPVHQDVRLDTDIGGLRATLPLYVSAFGSTRAAAGTDLGTAVSRQAAQLGLPMVVGENVVPVNGYRQSEEADDSLLRRIHAYAEAAPPGVGGVAVQQSTEDADTEVWNLLYSDPSVQPLVESGRLAFELKVGQGAKPGLGGMTMIGRAKAEQLAGQYTLIDFPDQDEVLRCGTPGTFTQEILRQQVRSMRNNYPRARIWVKLPPGRDVGLAAETAWQAGADAVTLDGAAGGTGWAPSAFLDQVGLPLDACLRQIESYANCLLVSSRMWEGARVVKSLALGARAAGLGRAALLAADEDPERGLVNLVDCLALELRLLISALGKYRPDQLGTEDLWSPAGAVAPAARADLDRGPIAR